MTALGRGLVAAFILSPASLAFSQLLDSTPNDAVRVNVTLHADGSRTTYEFDPAHHKATATTTSAEGEPRGKIEYDLDEAGRFARGRIFGPDGQFRFRTIYRYDEKGRLLDETQYGRDDAVTSKIVYAYDPAGTQTGYSTFDASGKLLGRVSTAPTPTPSPKPKTRRKL
jgi:hypothetical protein